jgi:orotate phosphoribosyltransferase
MNLFTLGNFILNSGKSSNFKIECDALTDADWDAIAEIILGKFIFNDVYGIPRGGVPLADRLRSHTKKNACLLLVDDVLTTGNSMLEARQKFGRLNTIGVVLFARGECPDWIHPIFQMWE